MSQKTVSKSLAATLLAAAALLALTGADAAAEDTRPVLMVIANQDFAQGSADALDPVDEAMGLDLAGPLAPDLPAVNQGGPQPEPPTAPALTTASPEPQPVAMLLPAIQAAREAARRSNAGLPAAKLISGMHSASTPLGPGNIQKKHLATRAAN